jgi:hypothetical protein
LNIKKIGIISVLLLIPAVSFAESAQQIYNTDLSIQYLRFMFGEVEGTVVTGGGREVLTVVLTSFNMAVRTLGAIVIL